MGCGVETDKRACGSPGQQQLKTVPSSYRTGPPGEQNPAVVRVVKRMDGGIGGASNREEEDVGAFGSELGVPAHVDRDPWETFA